jgi:hypothetical protein
MRTRAANRVRRVRGVAWRAAGGAGRGGEHSCIVPAQERKSRHAIPIGTGRVSGSNTREQTGRIYCLLCVCVSAALFSLPFPFYL